MGITSEPAIDHRDIRCAHSESLPALLTQLRLSVLISTYQTGHLVVVSARQGRLVLTFHQFERAMGSRRPMSRDPGPTGIPASRCGRFRQVGSARKSSRSRQVAIILFIS